MESFAATLTGGLLLGLAGALHCAAMCGGLASGGAMLLAPRTPLQTIATITAMMAGRIFVYSALGALVAASVEFSWSMMQIQADAVPMAWLGAAMLVWIGLSTAGMFPSFAIPTTGTVALVNSVNRMMAPVRRVPQLAPFAVGMVWGLSPCPLVYAALFTAALTGSLSAGFIWMLGFGIGTVPAVALSAFGINALAKMNFAPYAKLIAGISIALFGIAIAFLDLPVFSALCTPKPQ